MFPLLRNIIIPAFIYARISYITWFNRHNEETCVLQYSG
jgi:hypothetical protein